MKNANGGIVVDFVCMALAVTFIGWIAGLGAAFLVTWCGGHIPGVN
jgi:hypothetical protein